VHAALASGPPARAPRVAALSEAPFPEAMHRPEAASKFPPPLLAPRTGRPDERPTDRWSVPRLPCRALLPRSVHAPRRRRRRSFGRRQPRLSPIKGRCPPHPAPSHATLLFAAHRTSLTALGELFSPKSAVAKQHLSLAVNP
jgi:hypothetical protein